ncbi:hypothetical protein [Polaromonas hydrogenivorans]|uniref:Uncharacterized protein n=1 Tax=Polaromonas hydrogenivorans TaxID=335476 RepID=A0AAU7LUW5_9BURK
MLEPLDHIECRDALLTFGAGGAAPVEAEWPKASVVMGNPPFLGDKKMRAELGNPARHLQRPRSGRRGFGLLLV